MDINDKVLEMFSESDLLEIASSYSAYAGADGNLYLDGWVKSHEAQEFIPLINNRCACITEQDAREILESFRIWDKSEYLGASHDNWLIDTGRKLLEKLNGGSK